jgi:hypothetical protein
MVNHRFSRFSFWKGGLSERSQKQAIIEVQKLAAANRGRFVVRLGFAPENDARNSQTHPNREPTTYKRRKLKIPPSIILSCESTVPSFNYNPTSRSCRALHPAAAFFRGLSSSSGSQ